MRYSWNQMPLAVKRTFLEYLLPLWETTFRCNISGALRDASAATATKSFLPKNAIRTAWLKEENHLHWHTEVAEAMS